MRTDKKNKIIRLRKHLITMVLIICFLIFSCFFGSNGFSQNDRVFDPDPEGKFHFPGGDPSNKGKPGQPSTPSGRAEPDASGDCDTQNLEYQKADIVEKLTDYEAGQFIHLNQADFAYRVSSQITTLINLGNVVDKVKIVGFADGIPNSGKYYPPSLFLGSCGSLVTSPVGDNGLAFLRACSISHLLSEQTGSTLYADTLETDKCDIADGGRMGGQHRKVVVYAFFRKK